MPSFHEKFSDLMLRRRLSQTEASKALGVDQKTVSNWMSGKILPKPQKIRLISEFFSIPPDILVDNAVPLPADMKAHLAKSLGAARQSGASGAAAQLRGEIELLKKGVALIILKLDEINARLDGAPKKISGGEKKAVAVVAQGLKSKRSGNAGQKFGA